MYNNASYAKKPDNDIHNFHQIVCIGPYLAIYSNLSEKFQADVEIEDGAHTNWAKEPNIQSLSLVFDLMDVFAHGKYDGGSSKEKDQDTQEEKAIERNYGVMNELIPWGHSTEPDKD